MSQKKLEYFSGNYDSFINTLGEKNEEQEKRYKQEQDQIQHMKEYVARFGQGNAKMAKQAQSKEKTLEKMLRSGLTEKVYKEKSGLQVQRLGEIEPLFCSVLISPLATRIARYCTAEWTLESIWTPE